MLPSAKVSRIATTLLVTERPASVEFPATRCHLLVARA
jgi:hypothetical protein